mmetsp:Transcript_48150/g.128865  ORF Transcript_48150/g.128865 Transcript_48150/m.128865 type:complete len:220 (+) Transcript_48150:281-940(+)
MCPTMPSKLFCARLSTAYKAFALVCQSALPSFWPSCSPTAVASRDSHFWTNSCKAVAEGATRAPPGAHISATTRASYSPEVLLVATFLDAAAPEPKPPDVAVPEPHGPAAPIVGMAGGALYAPMAGPGSSALWLSPWDMPGTMFVSLETAESVLDIAVLNIVSFCWWWPGTSLGSFPKPTMPPDPNDLGPPGPLMPPPLLEKLLPPKLPPPGLGPRVPM